MTHDTTIDAAKTDYEYRWPLIVAFNELPELIDGATLREACQVKRKTVGMWRTRNHLPTEDFYLNHGPVWRRDTLREFMLESPYARRWRDDARARVDV